MPTPTDSDSPSAPRNRTGLYLLLGGIGLFLLCSILIFGSVLLPVFTQAKTNALMAAERASFVRISDALNLYLVDSQGVYPPDMASTESFARSLAAYKVSPEDFRSKHPDGGKILTNPKLAGVSTNRLMDPGECVALYDDAHWGGDYTLALFADSSVRRLPSARLESMFVPRLSEKVRKQP